MYDMEDYFDIEKAGNCGSIHQYGNYSVPSSENTINSGFGDSGLTLAELNGIVDEGNLGFDEGNLGFDLPESNLGSMGGIQDFSNPNYVFNPFQDASPRVTDNHNAEEPGSDTKKFHNIMFFYTTDIKGKTRWYKKLSTEGDENSLVIDEESRVLCAWDARGDECKGRCLITQTGTDSGKCRVPKCSYVHQPNSGSSSSSGQTPSRHIQMHLRPFLCPYKGCEFRENGSGFSLKADLLRHIGTENSHNNLLLAEDAMPGLDLDKILKRLSAPGYPCPHQDCDRHTKPFNRQDNLTAHRRSKHEEKIEKRKGRVKKASGRIGSKATNDPIRIQAS